MRELTHLSLFSGIGGIDIAAEWAGFRTVLFVEIDKYCQKVLRKQWPDVPIIGDIRDVTEEKVMAYTKGIDGERIGRTMGKTSTETQDDGTEPCSKRSDRGDNKPSSISPVTLITGGFPCQPVSGAGKRRGKEDDRWLWPEMLRVISVIKPTWVVAENVAGLLNVGIDSVLSDLEGCDYEVQTFAIPACGVNAPHRRNRIFIVAHALNHRSGTSKRTNDQKRQKDNKGREGWSKPGIGGQGETVTNSILRTPGTTHRERGNSRRADSQQNDRNSLGDDTGNRSEAVSDTKGQRLEGADAARATQPWGCPTEYIGSNWWAVEPKLGRVAHGIPHRVDRLRCLGNAVVPQQIYPILKGIADIERVK